MKTRERRRSGTKLVREKAEGTADSPRFDGGGGARARGEGRGSARSKKEEGRAKPLGAGFMRPSWGHRTLLMWHRTRPVTTGLMHREVCKSALHRTMGTGRWL